MIIIGGDGGGEHGLGGGAVAGDADATQQARREITPRRHVALGGGGLEQGDGSDRVFRQAVLAGELPAADQLLRLGSAVRTGGLQTGESGGLVFRRVLITRQLPHADVVLGGAETPNGSAADRGTTGGELGGSFGVVLEMAEHPR